MNDKKVRIRKYLDQFEPGHCLVAREAARALGITVTEVVACLRMREDWRMERPNNHTVAVWVKA